MRKFLLSSSMLVLCSVAPLAGKASGSSSVTLTATPSSAAYGSPVTLVATVEDQNGNPLGNGAVTFYDGAVRLGTVQVISTVSAGGQMGTATLTTILTPLGSNSITATYAGAGASGAAAPVSVTVTGQYPAIAALTASGSAGDYSLTATVLGAGPVDPSGSALFNDSTTGLEIGTATFNPATLVRTFTAAAAVTGVTAPLAAALADINGDGIPDLVTGSAAGLFVQLGNGSGSFRTPVQISSSGVSSAAAFGLLPGSSIVFGDFNGDGKTDIAFVACAGSSCAVGVLLGNGDGTFQAERDYDQGGTIAALAADDFNGDGILDIAVANYGNGTVDVLLGNGDGAFQAPLSISMPGASSLAAADLNGDGKLDLAVSNWSANTVSVLMGNGDGTFQTVQPLATGTNPSNVSLADLRGIGILDIVNLDSNDAVSVLLGNGNGAFQPATPVYTAASSASLTSLAVADVNGDGKPDLVVSDQAGNAVDVLVGNSDGTFQIPASYPTGAAPLGVALGDVNHDGRPDIAVASQTADSISILLNQVTQTAALNNTNLPGEGTHAVFAAYSGDASFSAATSNSLQLAAALATPAMSLAGLPAATLAWGQALSLSVALSGPSSTLPAPTGTVSYSIDKGVVVKAALSAGSVIIAISQLSIAAHSISVTYSGDAYYTALPAQTLPVTVVKATPAITWSAPASINYGTALGAAQLNATASVAGTFSYSPNTGAVLKAGLQTLSVTFTPTNKTDYAATAATVPLTVNPATPAIAWATPAAISYGVALNGVQLNATSKVPGTFAYSPASGTVLTAGPQTLSVTFTPTDAIDFASVTAAVPLTVNQASPAISWPTPRAINYGTVLGAIQLDATSRVAGTFTYSPAAGTVLTVGYHTLSVIFTPNDTTDYTTSAPSVTLVVNVVTPAICWPTPGTIPYGTTLGVSQLDASSPVAGTFAYSPAAGTILTAGSQTLSVTFTPNDATDYNSATATVKLTVGVAKPAINWAAPAPIAYGTTLSATQLDASSPVAGTFVYSPASGTVLTAGPQTLSVTFTPNDATDYNSATATVKLTVSVAKPAISWAAPAPIVYGTALSATQLNASSAVAGTFVYTPATGAVLTSGAHSLSVTFIPNDTTDYTTATSTVTQLVGPEIITPPSSTTVTFGRSATFKVGATGAAPLIYQWQYLNGSTWMPFGAGTGYNTPMLTTFPTTAAYSGVQLRVVITDGNGVAAASSAATLTVSPVFLTQPAPQSVAIGSSATFSVVVGGVPSLTYQWQYLNGSTWMPFGAGSGYSTATLTTFPTTAIYNAVQLRVAVTDANGITVTSNPAKLMVGPAITTQPVSQTINYGSTATFTGAAVSANTVTYRWYYWDGAEWQTYVPGKGYNQATLTTPALTAACNGLQLKMVVTDGDNLTATSNTVTLTVAPTINKQPAHQTEPVNWPATFTVAVSGVPNLTYQWQYLSGTTWTPFTTGTGYNTPSFTTANNPLANNGTQINVVITDGQGLTVTSKTVTLTVIL